jgi:hypothetical protein
MEHPLKELLLTISQAPEAASCVSYLAAKGNAACTVPKGGSGVVFCSTSQSQIYGYAGGFQVSVAW